MAREAPKFRTKLLMRALAQRIYFHSRAGDAASFEAWSRAFERGELELTPPDSPTMTLRVI